MQAATHVDGVWSRESALPSIQTRSVAPTTTDTGTSGGQRVHPARRKQRAMLWAPARCAAGADRCGNPCCVDAVGAAVKEPDLLPTPLAQVSCAEMKHARCCGCTRYGVARGNAAHPPTRPPNQPTETQDSLQNCTIKRAVTLPRICAHTPVPKCPRFGSPEIHERVSNERQSCHRSATHCYCCTFTHWFCMRQLTPSQAQEILPKRSGRVQRGGATGARCVAFMGTRFTVAPQEPRGLSTLGC